MIIISLEKRKCYLVIMTYIIYLFVYLFYLGNFDTWKISRSVFYGFKICVTDEDVWFYLQGSCLSSSLHQQMLEA